LGSAASLAGCSLEGIRAQETVKHSDRSALSWPSLNGRCAGPDMLLYAWPGYRRIGGSSPGRGLTHWESIGDSRERSGAHVSIRPAGLSFKVEGGAKGIQCVGMEVVEMIGLGSV